MADNDNIRIRFTRHAETVLERRGILKNEVEAAVASPLWTEADPGLDGLTRSFSLIERDRQHYLRVVHRTDADGVIVVLTASQDRDAIPPEDRQA